MSSIKQAVLLCGGLGTRLRTLYDDRPKALVPVAGRPFIEYVVDMLIAQGIPRIHIAAGYRANQIKEWADQQTYADVALTVSIEPAQLGTAGGLKFTQSQLDCSMPMLVMNGDSMLMHARFDQLSSALSQRPEWSAVIAAVEMRERGEYGTVELGDHDSITAFREKADRDGGWVNGGIYLMRPEIMAMIPDHMPYSMEKNVFPTLSAEGKLGAVRVPGPLLDMGTPAGLTRTTSFIENRKDT